jgi:hypothetical protein
MIDYIYLKINPVLSDIELEFINDFSQLAHVHQRKKAITRQSYWQNNDEYGKYTGDFEVIEGNFGVEAEKEFTEKKLHFYQKYELIASEYCLFSALEFPGFFAPTYLSHQNNSNYRMDNTNRLILNHLHKIIHIFHDKGIVRQLLGLSFDYHDFNSLIIDKLNDCGYIIEQKDIYSCTLDHISGLHCQGKKLSDYWGINEFKKARVALNYQKLFNEIALDNDDIEENNFQKI